MKKLFTCAICTLLVMSCMACSNKTSKPKTTDNVIMGTMNEEDYTYDLNNSSISGKLSVNGDELKKVTFSFTDPQDKVLQSLKLSNDELKDNNQVLFSTSNDENNVLTITMQLGDKTTSTTIEDCRYFIAKGYRNNQNETDDFKNLQFLEYYPNSNEDVEVASFTKNNDLNATYSFKLKVE